MATKKKLLGTTAEAGSSNAWDIGFLNHGFEDYAWEVSEFNIELFNRFDVDDWETSPFGLFVNDSGEKMYVVGTAGDDVNEFTLDPPYNLPSATFVNSKSVGANPRAVFFKPDGSTMYVGANRILEEYALSTAWSVSSATLTDSIDLTGSLSIIAGIFIKADGSKLYCSDFTEDKVHEFNLSTAWDASTASLSQSKSVASEEATAYGVWFKDDGLKMYVAGLTSDNLNEYTLTTAWDVSTASSVQSFGMGTSGPAGISFAGGGKYFYWLDALADFVYSGHLGALDVSSQDTDPRGASISSDGTKMFVVGNTGNDVNEYTLSTAWDVKTATFVDSYSVSGQDTAPFGIYVRPDGLKYYVVGAAGDTVEEYSMTSEWDVSTSQYVRTKSVSAQEAFPTGVYFKPDGTKMYIVGTAGDEVNEYNLTTAWDISTLSHVNALSVIADVANPNGIFFKDDGLIMYVSNTSEIAQYSLTTAWDTSTATLDKTVDPSLSAHGLFFKPDGTMLFQANTTRDAVVPYNIE